MKYKNILHTDLHPSAICLGTVSFGTGQDTSTAFQLLDAFFENGGNFIDTAHVYGAWVPDGLGLSEKVIGQWIKARNIRDQIIISTKGAHPDLATMDIPRVSPQEIVNDIDESIRCLQTESIDLYWLHRDDPKQPIADIIETLNAQVKQGKIRYFGCSNWHVERIEEARQYAIKHGMAGFVGNQLMWSYAVPNIDAIEDKAVVPMDASTLDFHKKTALAIVAYTAQAHGFFAKVKTNPASLSPQLQKVYLNEENAKRSLRLDRVAQELSLSISTLSLAYLTNQAYPTFPISASANVDQILENVAAGDVELSTDVIRYLEKG